MPIQQPLSSSTFQARNLAALAQTGISQGSPGGKARAFGDIVGDQLGLLEGRSFSNLAQALLPYATGDNLDWLGEIRGMPRLGAQTASASVGDYNFTFYVLTGTFGQINSGKDIIVPAGTAISAAAGNSVLYTLDSDVTLPAGSSTISFSATSTADGTSGNAPAGVYTSHSYRGYTDSRYGSLLVTNNYGITVGRDKEDDDSYRYRISIRLKSTGGASEDDLRLKLLEVPGIQDVVFERQSGTFLAYIYSVTQVISPSLLQLCQAQLDQTAAFPLTGTAVAPDLVGISLSTTLTYVAGATAAQKSSAIAAATSAVSSYINNLGKAEFVINEAASLILNADDSIQDIGQPNRPISSVFIWRSRADGSRFSRYLVADYQPVVGERMLTENSISNPIQLLSAN